METLFLETPRSIDYNGIQHSVVAWINTDRQQNYVSSIMIDILIWKFEFVGILPSHWWCYDIVLRWRQCVSISYSCFLWRNVNWFVFVLQIAISSSYLVLQSCKFQCNKEWRIILIKVWDSCCSSALGP